MEKIKELKQGDIFNNYRHLCEFLEQPVYTNSKDKKSQLNRWKLYFNFEIRPNHSIKILEIYDESKIKTKDPIYSKEELLTLKPFQVGTIYDNYKQICTVLDGTVYNHLNHRERQMKNWKNYFNYKVHKNGSIEILEIFEIPDDIKKIHCKKKKEKSPKPKHEKIHKSKKEIKTENVIKNKNSHGNSIYLHHIEILLLQLLRKTKNNSIYITKIDLCKKLGILRTQFCDGELEQKLVKQILPCDFDQNYYFLKNFKRQIYVRLYQIINTSLSSMKKRGLINYCDKYLIYDNKGCKQVANELQQLNIELAEEEALRMLNMSRQFVNISGRYNKMYEHSRGIFEEYEQHEFVAYKKVLEITYVGISPIQEVDTETINNRKKELNKIIVKSINKTLSSAKNNHLKKIQKEMDSISIGSLTVSQTREYKNCHRFYNENYEQTNQILLENLVVCSD